MSSIELCPEERTFVRSEPGAIFVSLELSRSTWLITSLAPGGGQKMSRHQLRSGDVAGLLSRLSQLREKCRVPIPADPPTCTDDIRPLKPGYPPACGVPR